jgi:hypothetical protein
MLRKVLQLNRPNNLEEEEVAVVQQAAEEAVEEEHQVKFPNRKRCLNLHNQIFELLEMRNERLQSQVLSSHDLCHLCRWGKIHQHSQNSCRNIHR